MKSIQYSLLALMAVLVLALGIVPVLAQETDPNVGPYDIAFGPLAFAYPEAVARNANIVQFMADDPAEMMPGGPQPGHTQFILYRDLPAPDGPYGSPAGIFLYETANFADYPMYQERFEQLQTLLQNRPDLSAYEISGEDMNALALPYLPVLPAAQVIRARTAYIETESVQGIGYITAYKQSAEPFVDYEFQYTFQGISTDGQHYISLVVTLTAGMFPSEIGPGFDMEVFAERLYEYLDESIAMLNAGTSDDFSPALSEIDALVQSIRIEAQ